MTLLEEELLREHFPNAESYTAALARLTAGEPLAYILGKWYFYGETFSLNADTLIPRPDTEHLVDTLIERLPRGAYFADLGTGSGCIALSVLAHRPDCTALLLDICSDALDCARKNAQNLGVAQRCRFVCANMLIDPLDELYDAIVSNPPYIASDVIRTLSAQVRAEPPRALDGGKDGLTFYRSLLGFAPRHLNKDGFLLLEIGFDQASSIRSLCRDAGLDCEITRDYSGNDRMALVKPAQTLI